jgi:histidinol-phosphatase
MARFRARDLRVETKPDRTPVTEVDRGVEELVRARLETDRPEDAIIGEEFGEKAGASGRRWVIDPVDGTKNFSRGAPIWGTLLALQDQGRTVVGVASAPALGRRWWAGRGEGAYADGERIRVSEVSRLEDALVCYTSVRSFDAAGFGDAFKSLTARAWSTRGFSDFWGHVLVAEGTADAMLEPALNLWDYAPLDVIVEEAGGKFSDFGGDMPTAIEGASGVSTNGALHGAVLDALRR